MAYGKGGPGFGPNVKVYSFNLKTKDLPAPHFEVSTKDAEGNRVRVDTATRVSGDLIGIKHRESKFQNKTIDSVSATMKDGNDVYFISIPYTYLGRNILNSLCALKSFGSVEISVYKGKPKGDKPPFDQSCVRQNGEMVYSKFDYSELPKVQKVQVGKEVFGDATEVNNLFKREVVELDRAIRSKSPVVGNEEAVVAGDAPGAQEEDPSSDIPF